MTYTGLSLVVLYLLGIYVFALYLRAFLMNLNDTSELLYIEWDTKTKLIIVTFAIAWPAVAFLMMLFRPHHNKRRSTDHV